MTWDPVRFAAELWLVGKFTPFVLLLALVFLAIIGYIGGRLSDRVRRRADLMVAFGTAEARWLRQFDDEYPGEVYDLDDPNGPPVRGSAICTCGHASRAHLPDHAVLAGRPCKHCGCIGFTMGADEP